MKKFAFICLFSLFLYSLTACQCEHEYGTGVVKVEPTCAMEGTKTYTCTKCGQTREDTLPLSDHIYNDGVVTLKPTTEIEGQKTYTCNVCGDSYIEAIPKLPNIGTKENPYHFGDTVTIDFISGDSTKDTGTAKIRLKKYYSPDDMRPIYEAQSKSFLSYARDDFVNECMHEKGYCAIDVQYTLLDFSSSKAWAPEHSFYFYIVNKNMQKSIMFPSRDYIDSYPEIYEGGDISLNAMGEYKGETAYIILYYISQDPESDKGQEQELWFTLDD